MDDPNIMYPSHRLADPVKPADPSEPVHPFPDCFGLAVFPSDFRDLYIDCNVQGCTGGRQESHVLHFICIFYDVYYVLYFDIIQRGFAPG